MSSRGINKVILIGHLGQDPEVRYIPNGGVVANIMIATSENWRDKKTGENKEVTEWHRVVLFGKLAELAGEYLAKGSQVYIEGQLRTRKWQDQEGNNRYTTEIIVNVTGTMQMLGTRPKSAVGSESEEKIKNINTSSNDDNEKWTHIKEKKNMSFNNESSKNIKNNENLNPTSISDFEDDIPF